MPKLAFTRRHKRQRNLALLAQNSPSQLAAPRKVSEEEIRSSDSSDGTAHALEQPLKRSNASLHDMLSILGNDTVTMLTPIRTCSSLYRRSKDEIHTVSPTQSPWGFFIDTHFEDNALSKPAKFSPPTWHAHAADPYPRRRPLLRTSKRHDNLSDFLLTVPANDKNDDEEILGDALQKLSV